MIMRVRWLAVLSMFVLGLSLSACELEEECDPLTDENCVVDAGTGDTVETGPEYQSFYYVLVEDQDQNPSGDTPGGDVDAVALNKGSGDIYLSQVHEAAFGSEQPDGDNRNFNNVLGAPEGTCDLDDEDTYDTFVSLGGDGGYFIGSFTDLEEIETGNTIEVFTCTGPASEEWDASVGVGTSISDPNWVLVINDGVGTATGTVPTLPQIPLN